jgi:hypothetical protein
MLSFTLAVMLPLDDAWVGTVFDLFIWSLTPYFCRSRRRLSGMAGYVTRCLCAWDLKLDWRSGNVF